MESEYIEVKQISIVQFSPCCRSSVANFYISLWNVSDESFAILSRTIQRQKEFRCPLSNRPWIGHL